jgi:LmbE family N-acetylglucosaminyl deacetylase
LLRGAGVIKLNTMSQPREQVRILAISPHLDDAVLSAGAFLAQAKEDGGEVTVFTVFAGVAEPPYSAMAQQLHASWGLAPDQKAPLYRRQEDIAAVGQLGVRYRHGRFLDVIYRRSPDGQWLIDRGRRPVIRRPQDNHDLVAEVGKELGPVIDECSPTLLATCVAIGNHVDHQVTRDAVLLAAADRGIPVRLWQDLPYAADVPDLPDLPGGLRLGPAELGVVRPEARTRKFQAVRQYASQLSMLDGSQRDLFTKLEEHSRAVAPDEAYAEITWPVVGL